MSLAGTWLVALGPSGEVLGATGGAPAAWVGCVLDGRAGVPAPLQAAARAVVDAARQGAAVAKAQVEVAELDASVELVAVAAIGLRRTATDVRALLRHAVAAIERQARALDVGLSVAVDDDVPASIPLDAEKIAWAVSALAGNAMRYVRRGTRNMPGGSVAIAASRDAARGDLVLVVEDDGPGIPTAVLQNLFRRDPGGLYAAGLALVMVREVVSAHGGSVEIDSSTDDTEHGTTVVVRIPISPERGLGAQPPW